MFECISNNEFQIKLQQVFEKTPSECPKEAVPAAAAVFECAQVWT